MRDESQGTLQVSFWRKLRIGETAQLCSLINHSLSEGLGRFPAAGFYWSNRPKSCQSFFPSICSGLFRKFRNLHNVGQLTTIIIYYIFIPSNPPKNGDFTGGKRMKRGGPQGQLFPPQSSGQHPARRPWSLLTSGQCDLSWRILKDTEGMVAILHILQISPELLVAGCRMGRAHSEVFASYSEIHKSKH